MAPTQLRFIAPKREKHLPCQSLFAQFQRRGKRRIKWRHLGWYRRRAGRGVQLGGWQTTHAGSQSPHAIASSPTRDNKSGSRLSCSELQRHIIKIFIESRVGGGREVGGQAQGGHSGHKLPLPACHPPCSCLLLGCAKFNLYCATNADREPSAAAAAASPLRQKWPQSGERVRDRQTARLASRWWTLILMWPTATRQPRQQRQAAQAWDSPAWLPVSVV